ncbi:hypothetical protein ACFPJ1_40865 [Kribbella qitaiheensis]|uniref:hypothetical protein n=1 Tax=Kribbella qitaiheensis TaxID=1544730 RepID=UPI00361A527B
MSDAYERAVELYHAERLAEMRDMFFRFALNRVPRPRLDELIAVMEDEDTVALRENLSAAEAPSLDRAAVDKALRKVISFADYDLHKGIECDEETGEDTYAEHVERFMAAYTEAQAELNGAES